jgi:hypothetical protein
MEERCMKTKKIRALIKHLELTKYSVVSLKLKGRMTIEKNGFNMSRYRDECDTPCCIAGHAVAMYNGGKCIEADEPACFIASKILGLEEIWARWRLFTPSSHDLGCHLEEVTPDRAILALTRMLNAGDDYLFLDVKDLWRREK